MSVQSPSVSRVTAPHRTRLVLAAMLLAVLTLSGCYKADVKVEVNRNDTLTGDIFIGVHPTAGDDALNTLDPGTIMTIVPGAVVTDAEDPSGYRGRKITFTNVPLDSLANPALKDLTGIEIAVERNGEQFALDGSFDGTKTNTGGGEPAQIHASFTFPGPVGDTNGTVAENGRTVSWAPAGGEKIEMHAVAAAVPANQTLMYAAIGGGSAAALLIGWLAWRRLAPAPKPKDAAPAAPVNDMKSKKQPKVKTRSVKAAKAPAVVHDAVPARQIVAPPSNWWDAPADAPPGPVSTPPPASAPDVKQPGLAHGEHHAPAPATAPPTAPPQPFAWTAPDQRNQP